MNHERMQTIERLGEVLVVDFHSGSAWIRGRDYDYRLNCVSLGGLEVIFEGPPWTWFWPFERRLERKLKIVARRMQRARWRQHLGERALVDLDREASTGVDS